MCLLPQNGIQKSLPSTQAPTHPVFTPKLYLLALFCESSQTLFLYI